MNWMHSCKRVAELLSQRMDEPLSLFDELKLRAHLAMCGNCNNVAQQLSAIRAASADVFQAGPNLDDDAIPADPAGHVSQTPGRMN